jgi:NAD(P)-dependent dehydrogenase (short-subunit alcohol dehydrogenase family)
MSTNYQAKTTAAPLHTPAVPSRFVGKVAVVTGANHRGIGGAIALRLAREGAAVMLLGPEEPGELIEQISQLQRGALWCNCDVTRPQDIEQAREACVDEFGGIDVVVNNAGIDLAEPFENLTEDRWQQLLDVNLSGVVRVSRTMIAPLEKRGGVMVNISSASAMGGSAGLAAYSATKAGINGLTQSLALELAPRGVRVVGVAPALVRTPRAARHVQSLTSEAWQKLQDCHPLGIGVTQDVAAAVAFLASNEARWITGVTLPLGWMPSYPLPFSPA